MGRQHSDKDSDMKTLALVSACSLAAFFGGMAFATYNPQFMAGPAPSATSLRCEIKPPEDKTGFDLIFVVSFSGNTWEVVLPKDSFTHGPEPLEVTPAAYILTRPNQKDSFVIDRATGTLSSSGMVAGSCSPVTNPKF
jgi:hypothetical protein